ncbi:DUF4124 domain-containing protein [Tahibacter caeni]|uniref:DUF4124 domain-containing protein n=1 Tax=Tahibacter caeni TaxID=1453545 RepID=UPI0021491EF9|nr:DUF4124 domain-containing protein [Tahibacter caeni]
MPYRLLPLSLSLLLFAWALPAPALTIHRCTGSDGTPAFQDRPCAPQQQSGVVVLRAEPVAVESAAASVTRNERQVDSRVRATAKNGSARAMKSAMRPRSRRGATAVAATGAGSSWECRAANGEIFYQHGPCPAAVTGHFEQRTSATRGRRRSDAQTVPVAGRPVARAEACRRIHAASASDRAGHERDEDVTTYERNLGRDPCR